MLHSLVMLYEHVLHLKTQSPLHKSTVVGATSGVVKVFVLVGLTCILTSPRAITITFCLLGRMTGRHNISPAEVRVGITTFVVSAGQRQWRGHFQQVEGRHGQGQNDGAESSSQIWP